MRENLGWLVGSIITAVAMAISWLISSGIFTTLLAVLVGAGITYFVQTRTQKKAQERAWKREYTLDIIAKVYGPLFEEIDRILKLMDLEIYRTLSASKYDEIESTYRYLMLDDDFKGKMWRIWDLVLLYNGMLAKIQREIIDVIIKEEAQKFLGFQPKSLELVVKGEKFNEWTSRKVDLPLTLLMREQPIEWDTDKWVCQDYSDLKDQSFHLEIVNPAGNPYSYTNPDWIKEFMRFWKRCSSRLEADSLVKDFRNLCPNFVEELKKARKELETRIQQQWKV